MTLVTNDIAKVESLLLKEFQKVPFHNLYYNGLFSDHEALVGGTCSDKTLAFRNVLTRHGIESSLYSAIIQGMETHRLLSVRLGDARYFVDAGNGWPSIKIFPADREINYSAFGITFFSKLSDQYLDIYQRKDDRETMSVRIPLKPKDELLIIQDIESRFSGDVKYPFVDGIRFAQVIAGRFLFLKKDRLRIYSAGKPMITIKYFSNAQIQSALKHYFNILVDEKGILACGY